MRTLNLRGQSGRVFVVGDIHGEFSLLDTELDKLEFDSDIDTLLSVGDLVDRGPQSHLALDYLSQDWFHAVRGNHEQMVIDAGGTDWHVGNGGEWFTKLSDIDQLLFVTTFKTLPLAMTVITPWGGKIGICHASIPGKQDQSSFATDWNDVEYILNANTYRHDCLDVMWDRYQVGRAKKYTAMPMVKPHRMREFEVANIDHVFMGHTPMKQHLTLGNCTWLDTGAFATGNLTIAEVTE